MNLTLRHKEADKRALLLKIKKDKFLSNMNLVSKQIKDHIGLVNSHPPKRKIDICRGSESKKNAVPHNHKLSVDTACSYLSTCAQSAEKRKKVSLDNPEHQFHLKQHLCELQSKNSHYAIRWKNPVSKITKSMRVIMGEWLMELSSQLSIPKNCIYNAMHYVDKYVTLVQVPRTKYQVVGLCSLFTSAKLQMSSHPTIEAFLQALDRTVDRHELVELEQSILMKLKFRLNPPTLYQYMVLLVSLFSRFISEKDPDLVDLKIGSTVYKNIFWMLDGVHLDNEYKKFKNKEKVCLAILYICFKKERSLKTHVERRKMVNELQTMNSLGHSQKLFEEFLTKMLRAFRFEDLKQCIQYYAKWAKFDRSSVCEQQQGELIKRIIFND